MKPHPRLCFGSLCLLELSEPYHQERYEEEASGVCVGPASRCSEGARVSGQRLLQRAAVWGSAGCLWAGTAECWWISAPARPGWAVSCRAGPARHSPRPCLKGCVLRIGGLQTLCPHFETQGGGRGAKAPAFPRQSFPSGWWGAKWFRALARVFGFRHFIVDHVSSGVIQLSVFSSVSWG